MSLGESEGAYLARCRLGGLRCGPRRAAFWRALGLPNGEGARRSDSSNRRAGGSVSLGRSSAAHKESQIDEPWAKLSTEESVPVWTEPFRLDSARSDFVALRRGWVNRKARKA